MGSKRPLTDDVLSCSRKIKSQDDDGQGASKQSSPPACAKSSWEEIEGDHPLWIYTAAGVKGRDKIAGFDIDGTIIYTVWSTNTWTILFPGIKDRLLTLLNEGYKVVFFTNQMGIPKGKPSIENFKLKVEGILDKLDLAVQVFVATGPANGPGIYKKPMTGMWDHLCEEANGGVSVDNAKSFFVGDAAGRPAEWTPGKKKDPSCSDRLFAVNIGLQFHTPEEYFLRQETAKYSMPEFDPRTVDSEASLYDPTSSCLTTTDTEVIVAVGFPASGKSTFFESHVIPNGYTCVNTGSWKKCVDACDKALQEGHSVVVDSNNPDVNSRKRYLDVAKAAGVSCRCFYFSATEEQAQHNHRFRQMSKGQNASKQVNMKHHKDTFEPPDVSEGFREILHINFVPKFEDGQSEALFRQFYED